jgi:hypothetical protein
MKSIEKINQVQTLKSLIAKRVDNHKATKKVARMSSLDDEFSLYATAQAQANYLSECSELFVLYTTYYILRHDLSEEARQTFIQRVYDQLRPEKKNSHYRLDREVQHCIEEVEKISEFEYGK